MKKGIIIAALSFLGVVVFPFAVIKKILKK